MEQNVFSLPPMPPMDFAVTKIELDRRIRILRFFQILAGASPVSQGENVDKMPGDVVAALEYIDRHLCEDTDVRTLAEACNVSVNTLERHFRENMGISPFTAIRNKRMIASMLLLRNGESVTDAARKSGFPDYSNYIQLFRKQFGMTPGKYKKLVLPVSSRPQSEP